MVRDTFKMRSCAQADINCYWNMNSGWHDATWGEREVGNPPAQGSSLLQKGVCVYCCRIAHANNLSVISPSHCLRSSLSRTSAT
jgi:hypothetical protein